MRQLRRDLDTNLRLLLERRDRVVEGVVHRAADECGTDDHLPALQPPSIMNAEPVTNDDSSLAR